MLLMGTSSPYKVLGGAKAIMRLAPVLEDFAARCGQPAGMHWLGHFLFGQDTRRKRFTMILGIQPEAEQFPAEQLQAQNLSFAVLFAEYAVLGVGTGIYVSPDASGLRSVIAPADDRAYAAMVALRVLMSRRVAVATTSFVGATRSLPARRPEAETHYKLAQRILPTTTHLPLRETYEETLAGMSKSLRFNLGYYRRRLQRDLPYEFVADAREAVNESELAGLNSGSLNPISQDEFRRRWVSSCKLRGGFLMGIRTLDGKWLSLLGGWRGGSTTVMHWQMNTAGFEKSSLVTVMRSHFIEHEIELAAERIVFYGGTPHNLNHAFVEEDVSEVIVRRRSLRAWLMQLSPASAKWRKYMGGTNTLGELLRNDELLWR
ncbi:hypothetical protein ACFQBQ_10980 [Granulicella cerasi]|uniref:BioF2-like acetyltransferase domain-containing protein n=1 Tax=Granulicella cerasi TaxID=741063 RepID=A0ABW1Z9F8_9BACT|nr:hypothetical protein [Granulicella cerasi]